jgi:hypothetical protein
MYQEKEKLMCLSSIEREMQKSRVIHCQHNDDNSPILSYHIFFKSKTQKTVM